MGLFSPGYMKEGKGVRKDEPPKKGIMRLFEIIGRDSGDIVKLNIIFIISCIPIITIGPALAALNAVMLKRVRNIPCYVFHEYKIAFKENFKKGLLAGIIMFLIQSLMAFALWFYYLNSASGDIAFLILVGVTIVALFITMAASSYLFTSIGIIDLPLKAQLKNSFLLAIGFLPRSALAVLIPAAITTLQLLFFPITIITLVIFHFSLSAIITNMNVWNVLEKVFVNGYFDKKESDDEDDENDDDDYEEVTDDTLDNNQ